MIGFKLGPVFRTAQLAAADGQYVLIDFWALTAWCAGFVHYGFTFDHRMAAARLWLAGMWRVCPTGWMRPA